jgi:sugar (pentulose or hexulose) kinase
VQADEVAAEVGAPELFRRTGLRPSYKYGLTKLLWLREHRPDDLDGSIWLSVGDWIVYRLTGAMTTDPTLAARTYAYNLHDRCWDDELLSRFGMPPSLFPEIVPSGVAVGSITAAGSSASELSSGTPAAVCGHDHLCALLAVGITDLGPVLDSIGTAESLLGVVKSLYDVTAAYESGLAIVPHLLPGKFCWLGGISAAGASLEWLRRLLGEQATHEEMARSAEAAYRGPTGILYFPYLSGSGAPCPDQRVRAALTGLDASHARGDVVNAVYEGTAYEAESILRTSIRLAGRESTEVIAVGGGTQNRHWLQIKADVSGIQYRVPVMPEATLLGAALAAGVGSGIITLEAVADIAARALAAGDLVAPDASRHESYRSLYEEAYMPMQPALRRIAG